MRLKLEAVEPRLLPPWLLVCKKRGEDMGQCQANGIQCGWWVRMFVQGVAHCRNCGLLHHIRPKRREIQI